MHYPLSFLKHSLLLASLTPHCPPIRVVNSSQFALDFPGFGTKIPASQKPLHPRKTRIILQFRLLLSHSVLVWAPPGANSETRILMQVVYFGGDPSEHQQGCKEVNQGKKGSQYKMGA